MEKIALQSELEYFYSSLIDEFVSYVSKYDFESPRGKYFYLDTGKFNSEDITEKQAKKINENIKEITDYIADKKKKNDKYSFGHIFSFKSNQLHNDDPLLNIAVYSFYFYCSKDNARRQELKSLHNLLRDRKNLEDMSSAVPGVISGSEARLKEFLELFGIKLNYKEDGSIGFGKLCLTLGQNTKFSIDPAWKVLKMLRNNIHDFRPLTHWGHERVSDLLKYCLYTYILTFYVLLSTKGLKCLTEKLELPKIALNICSKMSKEAVVEVVGKGTGEQIKLDPDKEYSVQGSITADYKQTLKIDGEEHSIDVNNWNPFKKPRIVVYDNKFGGKKYVVQCEYDNMDINPVEEETQLPDNGKYIGKGVDLTGIQNKDTSTESGGGKLQPQPPTPPEPPTPPQPPTPPPTPKWIYVAVALVGLITLICAGSIFINKVNSAQGPETTETTETTETGNPETGPEPPETEQPEPPETEQPELPEPRKPEPRKPEPPKPAADINYQKGMEAYNSNNGVEALRYFEMSNSSEAYDMITLIYQNGCGNVAPNKAKAEMRRKNKNKNL